MGGRYGWHRLAAGGRFESKGANGTRSAHLTDVNAIMNEKKASKMITSFDLRDARKEARLRGVTVPKLNTWRCMMGGCNVYFEVRDDRGNMIWEGNAYDASEAKAHAINRLIEKGTA
jgi:hypothetical protein